MLSSTCPLYAESDKVDSSKFFGAPNGNKPAPQQSKLSFASKAKPEPATPKLEPVQKEEDDDAGAAVEDTVKDGLGVASPKVKNEITDDEGDEHVAPATTSANGKKVKSEDSEAKASKKRAVDTDEADETASDEEPPTKKQRKKPAQKSVRPQKSSQKVKEEEADLDDEAEEANSKTRPVKQEKIKHEPQSTNITKHTTKAKPKSKAEAKAPPPAVIEDGDTAMENVSESDAQSEVDDAESDEEEQPEKAAKAREKVQSTFKSNTKDPYPDWKAGEPVPYAALCTTFSKIEMTTKRLEILAHCSLFLRQVLRLTPDDALPTVLLMIGKLAADYAGIELGIGESLIMKAIGESTGRSLKIIKEDQQKIGDLGLVAAKSKSSQPTMFKPKPLTIRGVHQQLLAIAQVEGSGGQGRKVAGIHKMLSAADTNLPKGQTVDINKDKGGPSEAKFIVRTLEGKMRLGLADKTVLVALAQAITFHDVVGSSNKVPSTDQLAKGESILKAVYR